MAVVGVVGAEGFAFGFPLRVELLVAGAEDFGVEIGGGKAVTVSALSFALACFRAKA